MSISDENSAFSNEFTFNRKTTFLKKKSPNQMSSIHKAVFIFILILTLTYAKCAYFEL